MKRIVVYVSISAIFMAGCKNHNKFKENRVATLSKDDSTFLALKDTAQKKLNIFIDSLHAHGKDYTHYTFLIKSDFVEQDKHEHMWSRIYERNNDIFKGIFIDSAYDVKNIKTGDTVMIDKNEIDDWSINNKLTGKTIGEFSIKYLKSKMQSSPN